jgi:hypothetical protein
MNQITLGMDTDVMSCSLLIIIIIIIIIIINIIFAAELYSMSCPFQLFKITTFMKRFRDWGNVWTES